MHDPLANESQATAKNNVKTRSFLQEDYDLAKQLIAELRKHLLDLTNRNNLLNFKFTEGARKHVRVIDELPNVLHRSLIDNQSLTFLALPPPPDNLVDEQTPEFLKALDVAYISDEEYKKQIDTLEEKEDITSLKGQRIERSLKDRVREQLGLPTRPDQDSMAPAEYAKLMGLLPSYEMPLPDLQGNDPPKHLDDRIQTLLYPDQMERKLSGLRDEVNTGLAETGINMLYFAFGYVEWYESPHSDIKLLAPLLLHPLQMDRKLSKNVYQYSIQTTGDRSEINIVLRERLRQDFGIELPSLDEDDTPETYFSKVSEVIKDRPGWRLRRFVTVGLFYFPGLIMYNDLDPDNWPNNRSLNKHPLLVELLTGSDASEQSSFEEQYMQDSPGFSPVSPLLVTDADSSQFSAIAAAMKGESFAIKGPPGTGKSQTITNIIAAALNEGKRVLFLAEKMAALDVVKKRLDDAGLGHFCLELHSTKAQRKSVLATLDKRRKLGYLGNPQDLETTIRNYEELRGKLTTYVSLINQSYGKSGKTIQELFWAELVTRDQAKNASFPVDLPQLRMKSALDLTTLDIERAHSQLSNLENLANTIIRSFGSIANHPWCGMNCKDLSIFDQENLRTAILNWRDVMFELLKEAGELFAICKIDQVVNLYTIREVAEAINMRLPPISPDIDLNILAELSDDSHRNEGASLLAHYKRYSEIVVRVTPMIECPNLRSLDEVSKLSDVSAHLYGLLQALRVQELQFDRIWSHVDDLRDQTDKLQKLIENIQGKRETNDSDLPITLANTLGLIESLTNTRTILQALLERLASGSKSQIDMSGANKTLKLIETLYSVQIETSIEDMRRNLVEHTVICPQSANDIKSVTADLTNRVSRDMSGIVPGIKVGDLLTHSTEFRQLARSAEHCSKTIGRFCNIIGLSEQSSVADALVFVDAIDLVNKTPRDIVLRRTDGLLDERNCDILNTGNQRAKDLMTKRNKLAERFKIPAETDSLHMREHAVILRSAGFWKRRLTKFKAAVNEYRLMAKSDVSRQERVQMASELDEVAAFLEEADRFNKDAVLHSICGSDFHGIETPFEKMLDVNRFGLQVRQKFRGKDDLEKALRGFLLQGSIDKIDELLGVASHTKFVDQLHGVLSENDGLANFNSVQDKYEITANRFENSHEKVNLRRQESAAS